MRIFSTSMSLLRDRGSSILVPPGSVGTECVREELCDFSSRNVGRLGLEKTHGSHAHVYEN